MSYFSCGQDIAGQQEEPCILDVAGIDLPHISYCLNSVPDIDVSRPIVVSWAEEPLCVRLLAAHTHS
jgi:hypothetical protein